MNNPDKVKSTGLANQLVQGAKTVLNNLLEADEKLKQYFFEMILLAYRKEIKGFDNLLKFLELTWNSQLTTNLAEEELPNISDAETVLNALTNKLQNSELLAPLVSVFLCT